MDMKLMELTEPTARCRSTDTVYDKPNPAYIGAQRHRFTRAEITSKWDRSTTTPFKNKINTMRKQAKATYTIGWEEVNSVQQMKSFVYGCPNRRCSFGSESS